MLGASANALQRLLPERVKEQASRFRLMWALGGFSKPFALVDIWRHRYSFARVQKAFFYHRYATALLLAHELGVLDELAHGARTVPTVAASLGLHERAVDAVLRILESEGFAVRRGGHYELSLFARDYLTASGRYSMSPILDLMAAQAAAFAEIPAGMRDGTVPKVLDVFDDQGRYKAYLSAVNTYLELAGRDLLSRIDLPNIDTLILGSMGVSFSALVLKRFPNARVTYGCLDHLVREIPSLRRQYHVPANRVAGMHAHSGDPNDDEWGDETFDLVFLTKKLILDPENRIGEKFASKAFEVLRPGGIAIFWETIHSDRKPLPLARAMEAVLDLGASPTGLINTEDGLTAMLTTIGYERVEFVHCLNGQTSFALARKP